MNKQLLLVDTHVHPFWIAERLNSSENIDEIVSNIYINAFNKYVRKMIFIGTSLKENEFNIHFASKLENCFVALGIHPSDVVDYSWQDIKKKFNEYIDGDFNKKIKAIGEIGIDLYHEQQHKSIQIDWFRRQIEYALEKDLPIVIHSRNAADETIKIIDEYKKNNLRGVVHCFGENKKIAEEWIQRGFYLGIGAYITYPKNAELREFLVENKLNKILLETDSPFLPLKSMRGKINEPMYVYDIAVFLSELLSFELEEVAHKTTLNAHNLFDI